MPNDWSENEIQATVEDYFAMLAQEMKGQPYSKAGHRRELVKQLNKRTEAAVEFKHQNISAILAEKGLPFIQGYKPAGNYQRALKEVVLAFSDQLTGKPSNKKL